MQSSEHASTGTAGDAPPSEPAAAASAGTRSGGTRTAEASAEAPAADGAEPVPERGSLTTTPPAAFPAAGGEILTPGSTAQLVASLLVVVALIFALGWISRRLHRFSPGTRDRALRLVDVLPVGTRERIAIIEAEGQKLVIGLAPGRVQTLHVLAPTTQQDSGAPDDDGHVPAAVPGTPSEPAFAGILSRMK